MYYSDLGLDLYSNGVMVSPATRQEAPGGGQRPASFGLPGVPNSARFSTMHFCIPPVIAP